ncbi:Nn.00g076390.m01.CDS01 [Neocucurbitaria sp. VM-36]
MATFSHLPTELVEYVMSYLEQSEVYAFAQVNKSLNTLAIPFLYRHVDLFIPPGDRLPRIDRFCLNIINDSRLASRVETLRLGLSPLEGVKEGQRWLSTDKHFDDGLMFDKAMETLNNETLVAAGDYLRDAIGMREYSAYAALILLVLPTLHHLEIADFKCASLDHLHTTLRNLDAKSRWNSRQPSKALLERLSSIKQVSLNVDRSSGLVYPRDLGRSTLDHILNLPGTTELEISIPDGQEPGTGHLPPGHPGILRHQLITTIRPTNITTLIIRHSGPLVQILNSLFTCTPQLRSITYDMFYDCKERDTIEDRLVDLAAWNDLLQIVKMTLEKLVFSVEYCDTDLYSFKQPRIGDKLYGYLDLTNLSRLHTLEVPFPFLTGDVEFSITTEIYPLLPPNLRHLSLRPDLSHAQAVFPFDTSILPSALTFQESESEARHLMNARMDVSYMFHATLVLLDYASELETISVWQPPDPSLSWFDGQVADFATTCRNKSVNGKIILPMLLRWKKAKHWNLIKEITIFDRKTPTQAPIEKFYREDWIGIPLGLASQYHLRALHTHQVRVHR